MKQNSNIVVKHVIYKMASTVNI